MAKGQARRCWSTEERTFHRGSRGGLHRKPGHQKGVKERAFLKIGIAFAKAGNSTREGYIKKQLSVGGLWSAWWEVQAGVSGC